jgi:hypothetical protein
MKRKVIQLKESELKKLISKIIEEQSVSNAFTQGQTLGMVQGQQARQAVNQVASKTAQAFKQGATAVLRGMTETVIAIGKIQIKVVIYGAAVVFLIGTALYRVGQVAANAIFKFLAATGKAVISAKKAAGQAVANSLKAAGIAIEKGAQVVGQQLNAMKDSTFAIAKYVVDSFKQFGVQLWAKVLIAAGGIKEFSSLLGSYLKTSWGTIQNKIGVAWENAANWASGAFKSVQNTANQIGNAVKNKASQFAQSAANVAGNTLGSIQGFLSEMYERYLSFSNDTLSILSEGRSYNGKIIL